jgi:hypothetical protein
VRGDGPPLYQPQRGRPTRALGLPFTGCFLLIHRQKCRPLPASARETAPALVVDAFDGTNCRPEQQCHWGTFKHLGDGLPSALSHSRNEASLLVDRLSGKEKF